MTTNEEKIEIFKKYVNEIIEKNDIDIWIGKAKTGKDCHLLFDGYTCQKNISFHYREPLNLNSNNITICPSNMYNYHNLERYRHPSYAGNFLFMNSSLCYRCSQLLHKHYYDLYNNPYIGYLPILHCLHIVKGKRDPLTNRKKPDRYCRNTVKYYNKYYCHSHYKALLNKLLKVSTSSDICDIIISYLE
jgi:hypothetical protein